MTVNGTPVDIDVPESRYLSDVLREDLRLTGTKIGCAEAECGICTVLVDSIPVVSCVYPAFKAQGTKVETIEGISREDELHPLQQAFLDHGEIKSGSLLEGVDEAERLIASLPSIGVDFDAITKQLQTDGVAAFAASFDSLLGAIAVKQSQVVA